jgi:hypothetical protein
MLTAIRTPIAGMLATPLAVGLNIVVPVIRIGGAPGSLPAAFTLPLTCVGRAELLPGGLRTRVKEFATSSTTPLFHTKLLFD